MFWEQDPELIAKDKEYFGYYDSVNVTNRALKDLFKKEWRKNNMDIADISRRSSCTGSDISAFHAHQHGANTSTATMIMLHGLYEEMEPQITPSYRPHVSYEPPSKPSTAQQRLRAIVGKTKTKLKSTHIMVQAVNEMQRKAVTKQKDTQSTKGSQAREST